MVAKYRRLVITEEVDKVLRKICMEISKRYEIRFLEIGTESDHVHFLIQSVPTYSPMKIVKYLQQSWRLENWNRQSGYYVSRHGGL